jgi:hypothetical protein
METTPIVSPKVPEPLRIGLTATLKFPSVKGAPSHDSITDEKPRMQITRARLTIEALITRAGANTTSAKNKR